MATIDLIVLGMLKKESLSAYDIQKISGIPKYLKMGKNQHSVYLQKGYSVGRKGAYYKSHGKRRENARKGGIYFDRRRKRGI